jgi:two-component system nitrate/nitrite response regulator NarL
VSIRVLLVDDHRTVLWGLAKLIESAAPLLELVGTAGGAAEALAAVRQHQPDVIVLDLDLGNGSDTSVVPQLRAAGAAKIVILTGSGDLGLQQRAVGSGASGLVHKSQPADVILKAITHVHSGALWLDRSTMEAVFASQAHRTSRGRSNNPHESLTPAEVRVMREVARHRSAPNKVIADGMHISAHTLRNHLASIYGKLGLKRRVDLVVYALERQSDRSAV